MNGRKFAVSLLIGLLALSVVMPSKAADFELPARSKPPSSLGKLFNGPNLDDAPPAILGETDDNGGNELPGAPVTSKVYDARLASLQRDISDALGAQNRKASSLAMSHAESDLRPIVRCSVIFQDTTVTADNRPLRSALTRATAMKSLSDRRDTLQALSDQIGLIRLGLTKPSSTAAANESATAARNILNAYEFGSDPIPPQSPLQQKLADWADEFGRWLHKIAPKYHSFGSLPDFNVNYKVARTILIVVVALALALLAYVLFRAIIGIRFSQVGNFSSAPGQSALAITAQEQELVASRDFTKLMQLAAQRAALSEYRDAYRLVYLAILVLLDSSGDLKIVRSRTNWEYLRHIEASGKLDLLELMHPTTGEFDRVWYGYGDVGDSEYEAAISSFETIRSIVLARSSMPNSGKVPA